MPSSGWSNCPVAFIADEKVWQVCVVNRHIERKIVELDELLQPERCIVSELRWLRLRLTGSREASLDPVKNMRKKRKADSDRNQKHDLERPYHPLILLFYQAAASGQIDLQFLSEDTTPSDNSREDIRCAIRGIIVDPSEAKAIYHCIGGRDKYGIDSNALPLGKLLQACMDHQLTDTPRLCTFISRIHCLWIVRFEFDDQQQISKVQVSPEFPAHGISPKKVLISNFNWIDNDKAKTLYDIMRRTASNGFRMLVRYVDTLCFLRGIPVTPLTLLCKNGNSVNLDNARVIAEGGKSVIIGLGGATSSVVKVSRDDLIDREVAIYNRVHTMKCDNLRTMLTNGSVSGVGSGLSFIVLQGIGEPLPARYLNDNNTSKWWRQAVSGLEALHKADVYHRDPKPDNCIIIEDTLKMNDFDLSCFGNADDIANSNVGTTLFQAPRPPNWNGYTKADDFLALALGFLYMMGFSVTDKIQALRSVVENDQMPKEMQDAIVEHFCYDPFIAHYNSTHL